ncbi:MAG: hypothetical protein ACYTDY_09610 [Planctomycetota bacterium]|jgi:hypothetical protein
MKGQPFELDRYIARKKVLTVLGAKFTIIEPEFGEVMAFVKQKAFKLKEDIRVYADDTMSEELLHIKARQVIDWAAAYDVTLPETGEKVGALRRKGFRSMFRDRWQILDASDGQLGEIVEDSAGMAFVRRFLLKIVPQKFHVEIGGAAVGRIRQFFNPFVLKYEVDFSSDTDRALDRRLGLAAVILLLAIEGRQD